MKKQAPSTKNVFLNFSGNIYEAYEKKNFLPPLMHIIRGLQEMLKLSAGFKRQGLTLGFIPTMGALHRGHLSLIEKARRENDRVAVSIFVNPLQFGPAEDYRRYPRPFPLDRRACEKAGVDILFHPTPQAMVPSGFKTHVEVETLSDILCGEFRPGHFRGVATIVLKLFETVRPDRAYFGEKDFQQLVIIRQMARDLHLPVSVVACSTVREKDGLALSSRNAYLSASERAQAPILHETLSWGAKSARRGAAPRRILNRMLRAIRKIPKVRIDYVRIVHADTLEEVKSLRGRMRILAAIHIGHTRLIDNVPLVV